MKLADFPLLDARVHTVTLDRPTASSAWKNNGEVRLWRDQQGIWLSQDASLEEVRAGSVGLDALLERKDFLWLLLRQRAAEIHLQCAQPTDWLPLDEPLDLQVDEKLAGDLARDGRIPRADVALAVAWCTDTFLIEGESQRLAAVRHDSVFATDWQIVGNGWRADLSVGGEGQILLKRVARAGHAVDSWSLVQGEIRFVDASVTTLLMSESQQARLRQTIQTHGDYVELWRRYSEQEWQRSLRLAAQLNPLAYYKIEEANQEGGAWRFLVAPDELRKFHEAWQMLESDGSLALEAGEHCPDWQHARYQDVTRTDFRQRFRGRPRFERGAVVIESDHPGPPEQGYLYLSLTGDRTVQERRQKALANINTSPRSTRLRYILQGVPVPVSRPTTFPALTPTARECFKHGKPTDSQEMAIKAALNTPDVALIIGPPGTGKTQVIAALSRRLSELGGESGSQHQVLITSFQHDAVENALARTQVYDLPSVKVGRNRGEDGTDPVRVWCDRKYAELEEVVRAEEAKEGHTPLLRKLHQELATLRHGQLDDSEREALLTSVDGILRELESDHRLRIPALLRDEWQQYLEKLPKQSKTTIQGRRGLDNRQVLRRVRALRVTPLGFADDGPDRATDAQLALRLAGMTVAQEDLAALADLEDTRVLDEPGASAATALRDRLLDAVLPDYRPPAIRYRLDAEGQRLIGAIEDALDSRLKNSRKGISGILARYRDTFVNHPSRSRETVREYATVVGATCQQAASTAMASLKDLSGIGESGISFDTVIIDEAARANPLDLFIPMSMAEKRIILVGDHRQLPHLLEPEVENELAERQALTEDQKKAFEDSLFERLWRQLNDRMALDRFPRVVMLDTQFRMHPVLGGFVSEQFYEKEKLPPVKSGRQPSDFMSEIPGYEGKVCAWLDVPLSRGRESKPATSWRRDAEVSRVADEVERLLKVCDPAVSIGVITFYTAQRDAIFNALSGKGITEWDAESGGWRVSPLVQQGGVERLRIGSVDAFQGKEFDIVLLSVVRSNDHRLPKEKSDTNAFDEAANSKYGHLRLSNRLNVAMSRQRSLLVAVGDAAMAKGSDAEAAVPALAAFLKLCGGQHGFVR